MMVKDRRVVVTGKIAGETRDTAEQKLREAGAIVQKSVSKDTDFLVAGGAVGKTKTNAAEKLGVTVITWDAAFGNGGTGNYAPPPRAPMPKVRQWAPMLCSPADEIPTGDGWLFEIKWDGKRGMVTVDDGAVAIQSSTGKTDFAEQYPYITADLAKIKEKCVLDGELVDIDGSGDRFIAFDILEHNGVPCVAMSLENRRALLEEILEPYKDSLVHIGMSPGFDDGESLLKWVADEGHEGVVAKKLNSTYSEGVRGPAWLKIKVRVEQEFIVLGYTKGEGAREATLGALVLGYREKPGVNQPIVYAGKVGTGWDEPELKKLRSVLDPLKFTEIEGCPWEGFPKNLKNVTWLHPEAVVQVAFQCWTGDPGVLWHPSYQRLRSDKLAEDVVRET